MYLHSLYFLLVCNLYLSRSLDEALSEVTGHISINSLQFISNRENVDEIIRNHLIMKDKSQLACLLKEEDNTWRFSIGTECSKLDGKCRSDTPLCARMDYTWESDGWMNFFVSMKNLPGNTESLYYLHGYMEGVLSREYLSIFYALNTHEVSSSPKGKAIEDNYYLPIMQNCAGVEKKSGQDLLAFYQLKGTMDGYNKIADILAANRGSSLSRVKKFPKINALDLFLLNSDGQLSELVNFFGSSGAALLQTKYSSPISHHTVSSNAFHHRITPSIPRCSALVYHSINDDDTMVGHTTWEGFREMVRVLKQIEAVDILGDAYSLKFTSYPGAITSTDDWVTVNNLLVVTETTTEFQRPDIPDNIEINAIVPDFVRVLSSLVLSKGDALLFLQFFLSTSVSNDLSPTQTDPHIVTGSAKNHLSGTYNSQWILVDMNVQDARRRVRVVETYCCVLGERGFTGGAAWYMPFIDASTTTNYLSFSSHNVPYTTVAREALGFSDSEDPIRGRLFQKIVPFVNNSFTNFGRVISFNDVNFCDKILATERCDSHTIAPLNADGGGADSKITRTSMIRRGGEFLAYSGPPKLKSAQYAERNDYVSSHNPFARFTLANVSFNFNFVLVTHGSFCAPQVPCLNDVKELEREIDHDSSRCWDGDVGCG